MYGTKIQEYLNSNGIESSFLAHQLNIDNNSLNTKLSGNSEISTEEYVAICNALDVDYNYFFNAIEKNHLMSTQDTAEEITEVKVTKKSKQPKMLKIASEELAEVMKDFF